MFLALNAFSADGTLDLTNFVTNDSECKNIPASTFTGILGAQENKENFVSYLKGNASKDGKWQSLDPKLDKLTYENDTIKFNSTPEDNEFINLTIKKRIIALCTLYENTNTYVPLALKCKNQDYYSKNETVCSNFNGFINVDLIPPEKQLNRLITAEVLKNCNDEEKLSKLCANQAGTILMLENTIKDIEKFLTSSPTASSNVLTPQASASTKTDNLAVCKSIHDKLAKASKTTPLTQQDLFMKNLEARKKQAESQQKSSLLNDLFGKLQDSMAKSMDKKANVPENTEPPFPGVHSDATGDRKTDVGTPTNPPPVESSLGAGHKNLFYGRAIPDHKVGAMMNDETRSMCATHYNSSCEDDSMLRDYIQNILPNQK